MTGSRRTGQDGGELAEALLDRGYAIVRGILPRTALEQLDADLAPDFETTPFGHGNFYGPRTKRFGRLLARSRFAERLILQAEILNAAEALLLPYCDVIQLNVAQAIAVHPGSLQQMPHRDQDMWRIVPGVAEYLVNVIWPFTRFTADNGATLIWPDTHGANANATELRGAPVVAEMEPGDALLFLGSTVHGAGANHTSGEVRRGCVIGYSLGWLKPYENQMLAYPPALARNFAPETSALIGYRQHRPNLGNYEGQCPSILLRDDLDRPIGAIDALRPDQVALVDAFAEDQRRMP